MPPSHESVPPESDYYTPYSDLLTRNLVLQLMDEDPIERHLLDWEQVHRDLVELTGEDREIRSDEDAFGANRDIRTVLESRDPSFRYTAEYYRMIKNERERGRAYQALEVSGVQLVDDVEAEPFKYLQISEDATFEDVRAAYIRLSLLYHPDRQNIQSKKRRELLFPKGWDFEDGTSLLDFVEDIDAAEPPRLATPSELEEMTERERRSYGAQHREYRSLEEKHRAIENEMKSRAHEIYQRITRAYRAVRATFSEGETGSLGGFETVRVVIVDGEQERQKHERVPDDHPFLGGIRCPKEWFRDRVVERIDLEGNGAIEKDVSERAFWTEIRLAYDFGEVYSQGPGYMQSLRLKPFFAWTELEMGKEVSALLLDEVAEEANLSIDQVEQLRLMITNRESIPFILDTLRVEGLKPQSKVKAFARSAYDGPVFHHTKNPREDVYYDLGVEITPEEGLVLRFRTQGDQNDFAEEQFYSPQETTAQFTPADFKVMQVLAYGPMLAEMNRL